LVIFNYRIVKIVMNLAMLALVFKRKTALNVILINLNIYLKNYITVPKQVYVSYVITINLVILHNKLVKNVITRVQNVWDQPHKIVHAAFYSIANIFQMMAVAKLVMKNFMELINLGARDAIKDV